MMSRKLALKLASMLLCACILPGYSNETTTTLSIEQESIQEMYQEKFLEPGFLGGYINWGFWKEGKPHRITNDERIEASRELYRQVFKAAKISERDSVLEVGCGKGRGAKLLFEEVHPGKIVGVDLNSKFVSYANKENTNTKLVFIEGDACNLQFNEEFSKLICVEASQHFLDVDSFLVSANHALKQNGKLVIAGFFTCKDKDLNYLKDRISTVKNNIDIVRNVKDIKNKLLKLGFSNIRIDAIGNHVIPQYEDWLIQVSYENMWAKEWKTAYKKGKIDYYIISAEKLNAVPVSSSK